MSLSESTPLLNSARSTVHNFTSQDEGEQHAAGSGKTTKSFLHRWNWHPSNWVILISALSISEGLLTNLGFFLEYHGLLEWSPAQINMAELFVANIPQVLSVVTGALTDTKCSRYAMLHMGLALQLLGAASMLCSAGVTYFQESGSTIASQTGMPNAKRRTMLQVLVLLGLVLVGLGMAAIRGSIVVLGMDQFWRRGETVQKAKEFFPLYYWWINMSALINMSLVSFFQVNCGFFVGFMPVFVSYGLSIVLLHCCKRTLFSTQHLTDEGGIVQVFSVYLDAFRVWRKQRRRLHPEPRARRMSTTEETLAKCKKWTGFLSYADTEHGGTHSSNDVVDARNFYNLLLVLIPMLFYSVIMSQTITTFTAQGTLMKPVIPRDEDTPLGPSLQKPFVPSGTIAAVSCLSIVVCIPVFHGVVYPRLERLARWRITLFRRMGIGMIVAALSVLCAAVVEMQRRKPDRWNQTTIIDPVLFNHNHTASNLPIFWQLPQYILSGVAETLVYISALEFAYAKSPKTMKGLCIALVYTMSGISGLLSAGLMALLVSYSASTFYHDSGPGGVHYFFFSLVGVILLGKGLFTLTTWRYKFRLRTSPGV
ncbi:solute carrier family 15 member 4-like isoform X2 [Sycon ciliatum]|uniref:solute carrier family 15 member 4-like isoform X2 n=1 Tax=Sycon ciliatum TaxID=27933 RepID=UPI0031F6755E